MTKVILGMSGGVDSSVTAHLLKERGFEVEGVSFMLWEARSRSCITTCCSLEATAGAAKTAERLGIRHDAVDVRAEFIEQVIEPFVDSYMKGLTPNPCILCNRHIKFPFLLAEAQKRGAELIATGHYARVVRDGAVRLMKGIDHSKDQSYVLYALRREELGRLVLPLGDFQKTDVRRIARDLRLEAADRPESQEICFIEGGSYAAFIERLSTVPSGPGPVIDLSGNVLGSHKGLFRYTLGQRKGLGISSPEPYYVVKMDVANNSVYVGRREDALIRRVTVKDMNWLVEPKDSSFSATVKVRSMMKDEPASIDISGDIVEVRFDQPQWPPSPGQSAVIYDGEFVIGGGTITSCGN